MDHCMLGPSAEAWIWAEKPGHARPQLWWSRWWGIPIDRSPRIRTAGPPWATRKRRAKAFGSVGHRCPSATREPAVEMIQNVKGQPLCKWRGRCPCLPEHFGFGVPPSPSFPHPTPKGECHRVFTEHIRLVHTEKYQASSSTHPFLRGRIFRRFTHIPFLAESYPASALINFPMVF